MVPVSMSPIAIPEIKMIVRGIRFEEVKAVADEVMKLGTKAEIRARLQEVVRSKVGNILLEQ